MPPFKNKNTTLNLLSENRGSLHLLDAAPGSKAFIVAQSRTVLALQSLDKKRQQLVVQFLQASGLNQVGDDKDTQEFLKTLDPFKPFKLPNKAKLGLLFNAQMKKANLANSDLSGATLIRADLGNANLGCNPPDSQDRNQCSDLSSAYLRASYLKGANLRGAKLRGTRLSYADLRNANLRNADLRNGYFQRAYLSEADFKGTDLKDAVLLVTDLYGAENLSLKQLTGEDAPLLCNVRFPKNITGIDPYRDCDRIPQKLVERYPKAFPELQRAKEHVDYWRQKKFE